jgi:hypothetical protein
MRLPKLDLSILAKISKQGDLGLEKWYEVVCYHDNKWHSFAGSETFNHGEQVVEWAYCIDLFN